MRSFTVINRYKTNSYAFTVIELLVVISIIGILVTLTIPGLIGSKHLANETAATSQLKNFSTAMANYYMNQADSSYPKDETQFGTYFSNVTPKSGYAFIYQSNASATTPANKIIYYAYPLHHTSGKKIFIVDESCRIWEAKVTDYSIQCKVPGIDFSKNGEERVIDPNNLTWILKS